MKLTDLLIFNTGRDHVGVAVVLNNLAAAFHSQGNARFNK